MNDNFYQVSCEDDVVSLTEENYEKLFIQYPVFKVKDIVRKIQCKLLEISENHWNHNDDRIKRRKKWVCEGIDGEVLHLGAKSWKKGKIRINVTVEFCPDEPISTQPESLLDDIRQLKSSTSP